VASPLPPSLPAPSPSPSPLLGAAACRRLEAAIAGQAVFVVAADSGRNAGGDVAIRVDIAARSRSGALDRDMSVTRAGICAL